MQYNKGMLSDARETYEARLENKNSVEICTKLINLFHSVPLRKNLSAGEKSELIGQIKKEITNLKPRLPKHFCANIPQWLNNRDKWLSR
jgi:hypothetical protein